MPAELKPVPMSRRRSLIVIGGMLFLTLIGLSYFFMHGIKTPLKHSIDALSSKEVRDKSAVHGVASKFIHVGMTEAEALRLLTQEGFEVDVRSDAGWDDKKYAKLIVARDKRPTWLLITSREIRILLAVENERVVAWEALYFTWP